MRGRVLIPASAALAAFLVITGVSTFVLDLGEVVLLGLVGFALVVVGLAGIAAWRFRSRNESGRPVGAHRARHRA
jgi:hypothetical protein